VIYEVTDYAAETSFPT